MGKEMSFKNTKAVMQKYQIALILIQTVKQFRLTV